MTRNPTGAFLFDAASSPAACALHVVAVGDVAEWLAAQPEAVRRWLAATGFTAEAGRTAPWPDADGGIGGAVYVAAAEGRFGPRDFAALPTLLPPGDYVLATPLAAAAATRLACGWCLGQYRFGRYRGDDAPSPRRLAWPEAADRGRVERETAATFLIRDLVNTPADDMSPEDLAAAAQALAQDYGARARVVVGDALLRENFPAIHAVGRAAAVAPRLIDLTWGDPDRPLVTLIGKGVCFDTGGLDLKAAAGMKLMKKDMGGAAHALGLASMVMAANLPVRLRVLIPAVENSVSGNALHPMDVIATRKGLSVEVGNTDAEGRLILSDALAEADAEAPALIVDFATLTGAARTALGPDLPAVYSDDEILAADLAAAAAEAGDPVWRLPLWRPYRAMLDSKVADINNSAESPFAGSITAALFLREFVSMRTPWLHIDLFAWNPSSRPGQPEGGEAQAMRAVFGVLARRYPVANS